MKRLIHVAACVVFLILIANVNPGFSQTVAAYTLGGAGGVITGDTDAFVSVGQPIVGKSGNLATGFWALTQGSGWIDEVSEPSQLPLEWEIGTAYPNPFNPSTQVVVSLPSPSRVRADVYNVLGRRVTTLADDLKAAGVHRLYWDAHGLASGIYFLRVEVPGHMHKVQKLVLVR